MKRTLLLALVLCAPAQAQTNYFPSNGMARWCWNGTAWVACSGTSSGTPTDKFPVNGRASWCWNGSGWVGCAQ